MEKTQTLTMKIWIVRLFENNLALLQNGKHRTIMWLNNSTYRYTAKKQTKSKQQTKTNVCTKACRGIDLPWSTGSLFYLRRGLSTLSGCSSTHYIALTDSKIMIFQPLVPAFQDYWYEQQQPNPVRQQSQT